MVTLTLKGYEVPLKAEVMDIARPAASRPTLEQVQLTVPAVDIELACAAFKSVENITDICEPAIAARVEADPAIQIESVTGKTFNFCTGN